ncbi:MAG: signal peptidase II [Bacilli bacterium]|nr:signal peptidase II [Bacilli bacterium]
MKKILSVSLIVFLLDRITKVLITNNFVLDVRNKVIDKFFYITNCHNKGAAFSLFSGNIIFLIIITLMVLFLIYRTIKNKKYISKISTISYGLLLGGILGNLFDRFFFGYVIDFLDFVIYKFDFAIFNVADIAIVVGAFMLLIFEGSDKNESKSN